MKKVSAEDVNIVVIGESTAGKTTWIASLFRDDISMRMRTICLTNREGQTKVKTYYELRDPSVTNSVKVKNVVCDIEKLEEYAQKETIPAGIQKFLEMTNIELEEFERQENRNDNSVDYVIDMEDKEIEIEAFYDNVVNNVDMVDSEIVQHITILGPAREQIWNTVKQAGIRTFTIRDTRGLLDETKEKYAAYMNIGKEKNVKENDMTEEEKENEKVRKLLSERGILGADACIYITKGGDALNKKELKNMYIGMLKEIIKNMPTFLVARNETITGKIEEKSDIMGDITGYKNWMKVDERGKFQGDLRRAASFEGTRMLLEECGLFNYEISGYEAMLAKKHFRQLLLAEVDFRNSNEDIVKREEDYYLFTVQGAFSEIVTGVMEYKKELQDIEVKLDGFQDLITDFFRTIFQKKFEASIYRTDNYHFDSKMLKKYYAEHIAGQVRSGYYGGLVGNRGGLTTWISGYGKKGKYAIELLETAYREFDKLVKDFTDGLEKHLPDIFGESDKDEIKGQVLQYLRQALHRNSYSYYATGMMIKLSYLYNIWKDVSEELQLNKIEHPYVFFSSYGTDMSIIYGFLFKLIMSVLMDAGEMDLVSSL